MHRRQYLCDSLFPESGFFQKESVEVRCLPRRSKSSNCDCSDAIKFSSEDNIETAVLSKWVASVRFQHGKFYCAEITIMW